MSASLSIGHDLSKTAFRSILGQDHACRVLLSALEGGRVPHAYLFAGPEGVGKRTTALAWAQVLVCASPLSTVEACGACAPCRKAASGLHSDVLWVGFHYQARLLNEPPEKQKSIKIDTVREMERALRLKPLEGRIKIAFLEPAERLVEAAAHALLKVLEEPPPGTHLVLLAADPGQLLSTIRSRCQWVRFRPLPARDILARLNERAAAGEPLPPEKMESAALRSGGSLGRALTLLEEGEELDFDWENAPAAELLGWCEQFQNPRLGREGAEDFLRRLLERFQADLRAGRRPAGDVRRALDALHSVRQYVSPSLVLQALLLRLRFEARKRAA